MPRKRYTFPKGKRHGFVTKYGYRKYVKSAGYAKGFGPNIKMSIKPTVKKNARQIKKLWKNANDGKYVLRTLDNTLVASSLGWTSILLNDINHYQVATPGYKCREEDATQVRLRNIRIRFTVHAVPNEAKHLQKCYVALVKTINSIGDAGVGPPPGIKMPDPDLMFDGLSTPAGNLLAPWEGFALTQGAGSETLKTTTILKRWTCYICPQGGLVSFKANTTGNDAAAGTIDTSAVVLPDDNTNYTQGRPSSRYFTYTHNCLQAKVKFENKTSDEPINVKYFLVALAMDSDLHHGFRLNASCKINFYDN